MAKSKSEKFQMRFVEISSTLDPVAYKLLVDCITTLKDYEECIDSLCDFSGRQYAQICELMQKIHNKENNEEP